MRNATSVTGLLLSALFVGCADLPTLSTLPGISSPKISETDTAKHRYEFQTNRTPASLDWLLVNRIHNGQSVAEVGQLLGETGERELADRDLKTSGDGHYLDSDVAYRWGPDAHGRTIVLFFRDGKLVNFDPDELR
jgi:hypothetical protein